MTEPSPSPGYRHHWGSGQQYSAASVVLVALLGVLVLGEQLSVRGWLGVVLVAQPAALLGGSQGLPITAVVVAIAGALLTSLAYVSVRSLANTEHPLVVVFYFPLVAFPLSLPLVLMHPVMPQPIEWLWLVGVGLFTQVGQVYLTRGLMALPAARATAISYVQVVFAGLLGWLVFGEAINGWTVGGAGLVLVATLLSLSRPKPAVDR